ncbi:ORF6N domain-containing protein [Brevibacillus parabrevis]|uniref:ORF6N domain-containing protein n=1 Tax=Brevibacillus parabrevis TaxID=54914 RepID=UPI003B8467F6
MRWLDGSSSHQFIRKKEVQILKNNFNRNKSRYTEGKYYITLEGKRDFLNLHQNDLGSKSASVLYLWTEKCAWIHVCSAYPSQKLKA